MDKINSYVVVCVTAKDRSEAKTIAQNLLQEKLAACVNIVDSVQSFFWWQGSVDEANEVVLIVKTRADAMDQVISTVKSLHSYETPEIIALPIVGGSKDYLNWIDSSVRKSH